MSFFVQWRLQMYSNIFKFANFQVNMTRFWVWDYFYPNFNGQWFIETFEVKRNLFVLVIHSLLLVTQSLLVIT